MNIQALDEFLKYLKENPRAILYIKSAIEMVQKIGLKAFVDVQDSDYCPYCGTEVERKIAEPIILITDGKERIFFRPCLPLVRDRAGLAAPIFSVGVDDLAKAVGKILLGKKYKEPYSPYLGRGTSAEFETLNIVDQIEKNKPYILAKYLKK